ncbi:enoyl-CoA hydratase/isomerase family protein [Piedraia hortae CBS 480.64]|uniref:Enoyl-CoA hydratase/isomerase family protein n=1 Tax=Piedraia hortae CBS 480.64 TaxID=1314780 RepID=A0A6A7BVF5_9PEZI|nr:enoyl-CoA hydratase/isomerase family protein [Piedraia hortae CBS 480.64]
MSYTHFNLTTPTEWVAHVEINRAGKLNSFHEEMWHELGEIFTKLSHDPNVRCVIFSGAGDRGFTSGLDVQAASKGPLMSSEGSDTDPARRATFLRRHISDFQACINTLETCEKPVICVLHGIAFGLALDLASACDIRICTKNVRCAVREVDIGLAADIGSLTRLPKANLPFSWIKDVCLTAREFGADEALRVGFVSEVAEDKNKAMQRAVELAGTIAGKSPVAVQATKEVLNWSRDHSVQDGLRYVQVWNSAMLQAGDVKSALMGGIQKKKPRFEKL